MSSPSSLKSAETPKGTLSWVTRAANFDNGYDAFSLDNLRSTLSDEPGRDQHKMVAHGATWQQPLASLELKVQLSHVSSELLYSYDEDWAYPGIHPFSYSSTDEYARDRDRSSLLCCPLREPTATPCLGRAVFICEAKCCTNSHLLFQLHLPLWLSDPQPLREISLPVEQGCSLFAAQDSNDAASRFSDSESVQFRQKTACGLDALGCGGIWQLKPWPVSALAGRKIWRL